MSDRHPSLRFWGPVRGAGRRTGRQRCGGGSEGPQQLLRGSPRPGGWCQWGRKPCSLRGAPAGVCRARVSWNHLKLWAGPPGPAEWGCPEGGPALRPRPWPCAVCPSGRPQFSGNGARALMSVGFRAGPGAAGKGPGCVCSFSSVLVVSRGTPEGLAFGDGLIPSFPTPMYRSTRRVATGMPMWVHPLPPRGPGPHLPRL